MSAIPLLFTSGWASGINAYMVVLMLGIMGRFAHMSAVPPTLDRLDVMAVAGALVLVEFWADKIPYVHTGWDALHTVIRPVIGGAIGLLMAHHSHGSLTQAVVTAAAAGGTALVSHLVKSTIRAANVSPDPVSHGVVSMAEDFLVAGLVALVLLHPLIAASIALLALVTGILLATVLAAQFKRYLERRFSQRRTHQASRLPRHEPRLLGHEASRSESLWSDGPAPDSAWSDTPAPDSAWSDTHVSDPYRPESPWYEPPASDSVWD